MTVLTKTNSVYDSTHPDCVYDSTHPVRCVWQYLIAKSSVSGWKAHIHLVAVNMHSGGHYANGASLRTNEEELFKNKAQF